MSGHSIHPRIVKEKHANTPEGMAYCPYCDQYKSKQEFSLDRTNKNGVRCLCKVCDAQRRDTPERRAYQSAYKNTYRASSEGKSKDSAYQVAYRAEQVKRALIERDQRREERERRRLTRRPPAPRRPALPHTREKIMKYARKHRYGISDADYQGLLFSQNGVCAICGKAETRKYMGQLSPLSVDHDHNTGAVRGLLCAACNHGLGNFRDSPENLSNAIDYLMGTNR